MFKLTLQKLLNIEQFCHCQLNKMKTKFLEKSNAYFLYYWKVLNVFPIF
jgi:hypothetical protein